MGVGVEIEPGDLPGGAVRSLPSRVKSIRVSAAVLGSGPVVQFEPLVPVRHARGTPEPSGETLT